MTSMSELCNSLKSSLRNTENEREVNNTAQQRVKDLEQRLIQNQEAINEAMGNASTDENNMVGNMCIITIYIL